VKTANFGMFHHDSYGGESRKRHEAYLMDVSGVEAASLTMICLNKHGMLAYIKRCFDKYWTWYDTIVRHPRKVCTLIDS